MVNRYFNWFPHAIMTNINSEWVRNGITLNIRLNTQNLRKTKKKKKHGHWFDHTVELCETKYFGRNLWKVPAPVYFYGHIWNWHGKSADYIIIGVIRNYDMAKGLLRCLMWLSTFRGLFLSLARARTTRVRVWTMW